jgi:hypothetical protein
MYDEWEIQEGIVRTLNMWPFKLIEDADARDELLYVFSLQITGYIYSIYLINMTNNSSYLLCEWSEGYHSTRLHPYRTLLANQYALNLNSASNVHQIRIK